MLKRGKGGGFRAWRGFTLVELLVVIAIIGVLVALLLPAVQAAREAARRTQCTNRLKQLVLGLHNYHDSHKALPSRTGGTGWGTGSPWNTCNNTQLSGVIGLLPFIEQGPLWDDISLGVEFSPGPNGISTPFGPAAWRSDFAPFRAQVPTLLCPSDGTGAEKSPNQQGRSNYKFSSGDTINNNAYNAPTRGPFGYSYYPSFGKISDGLSNTIAMGEAVIKVGGRTPRTGTARNVGPMHENPTLCLATAVADRYLEDVQIHGETERWADGRPIWNGMSTVLPPNSPHCMADGRSWQWGIWPPSSYHPGGVNIGMLDGSVHFISASIDTGRLDFPQVGNNSGLPSPYGVFGALGSMGGGETVQVP